jgi:hypothetical protein
MEDLAMKVYTQDLSDDRGVIGQNKFLAQSPSAAPTAATSSGSVDFIDFLTSGVAPGRLAKKPIGPTFGGFFQNGMAINFRINGPVDNANDYKVRQTIGEQGRQFVDGNWSQFSLTPAGTRDDYIEENVSIEPPNIYAYDAPGWAGLMVLVSPTLPVGTARSNPRALRVSLNQSFETWIEHKGVKVSRKVRWHNFILVERASDRWNVVAAEIEPGWRSR